MKLEEEEEGGKGKSTRPGMKGRRRKKLTSELMSGQKHSWEGREGRHEN